MLLENARELGVRTPFASTMVSEAKPHRRQGDPMVSLNSAVIAARPGLRKRRSSRGGLRKCVFSSGRSYGVLTGIVSKLYDETIVQALTMVREAADRICGKRLKGAIPTLLEVAAGNVAGLGSLRPQLIKSSCVFLQDGHMPASREEAGTRAETGAARSRQHPAHGGTSAAAPAPHSASTIWTRCVQKHVRTQVHQH